MKNVFISYSWDSQCYKDWVLDFCNEMQRNGINVILDQKDMQPGDYLTEFMENSIINSDYVLILCTPKYKIKADKREGGVGYEESIITSEVFLKKNHRKYITILVLGSWETSIPTWATGKFGIDFSNENSINSEFNKLVKTIQDSSFSIQDKDFASNIITYKTFYDEYTEDSNKIIYYDMNGNPKHSLDCLNAKNEESKEDDELEPLEKLNISTTDGRNLEIEVITILKTPDDTKSFLIYTFDSEADNVDIYASEIKEDNEEFLLDNIDNPKDLEMVQRAIYELSEY